MRILLLGGSKSGKSMMGQHMARRLSAGAPMYYWATLEPRDGEDRAIEMCIRDREQTLNQLLAELDGFDPGKGIIVLGATNRPEVLDKALLRPGRFDRRITVDRPNLAGRLATLQVHTRSIHLRCV